MARIVVLGAGLGGVPMAYEMKALCKKNDEVTVISESEIYHFVPSNPWVAVLWRKRKQIEVKLPKYLAKKGIKLIPTAAKKVHPEKNMVELIDGKKIEYDYLVIATGPRLAFEEIEGLGPKGFTSSVCHVDHAESAASKWEDFCKNPGPITVGAVQGASCFGPAYEHAFIMDHDLRKRKIRHKVPMTFITSEPYIGHLGLDGVGDSNGMLESALRTQDISWITNAKVDKVEQGKMFVTEINDDGSNKQKHELPFAHSMMLPAFTGVDAIMGIDKLVNPRGFVLVDEHQCNPTYENIYSVGVAIAIVPNKPTPVPTGVPKTGFMIESMVTATAHNIRDAMDGKDQTHKPTWNAICFADMGNKGIAFVAMPQIPPRNVNWMATGRWVHYAKVMFEWYFIRKIKTGNINPFLEKMGLRLLGIRKRQH